jgi:hypothetical protein
MVEDSEEELEVVPEPVLEVVQDEAPAEQAMIVVHTTAAPPPSRGARAPLLSAPHNSRGLRGCHQSGNGGGPGVSHPLHTRRHLRG